KPESLASGIRVELDGPVLVESVKDKPILRVVLDLPWPVPREAPVWSQTPIGYRSTEVAGLVRAEENILMWDPEERSHQWLVERFPEALTELDVREVVARFVIDGWAVIGEDEELHLSSHARTFLDSGRTRLALPTDDEVPGG